MSKLNIHENLYNGVTHDHTLVKLLERFAKTGRPINVCFRRLVPEVNGTDRVTHLIHAYPAKLLAHIPIFFLHNHILSKPGDTVLDPFCGTGTVVLEAMLADRTAIGIDINPLANLISRVKTTPVDPRRLKKTLDRINSRLSMEKVTSYPDVTNLDYWFTPSVKRQLSKLKSAIDRTKSSEVRDFFLVCLSQSIRKVSLADPKFSVPVRLRYDKYPKGHPYRDHLNEHLDNLKCIKVSNVFQRIAEVNICRMERLYAKNNQLPASTNILGDIRHLSDSGYNTNAIYDSTICDETIDLVITSPPYPGSQKYIRASSLSLGWLDLCNTREMPRLKDRIIGREETKIIDSRGPAKTGIGIADRFISYVWKHHQKRAQIAITYVEDMNLAIEKIYRTLKHNGHLVIVIGDGHFVGKRFPNHEIVQKICENTGFETKLILKDGIRSRSLQTKRHPTSWVMKDEWIILLEKKERR